MILPVNGYNHGPSTIFPVFVIRWAAGYGTDFGIKLVTRTSNVVASVPFGRKWENFENRCPDDVWILTVITVVSHLSSNSRALIPRCQTFVIYLRDIIYYHIVFSDRPKDFV